MLSNGVKPTLPPADKYDWLQRRFQVKVTASYAQNTANIDMIVQVHRDNPSRDVVRGAARLFFDGNAIGALDTL